MKISTEISVINAGGVLQSRSCQNALAEIRAATAAVKWPADSPDFQIFPESGKKRGEGSGVRPIRDMFVEQLATLGWSPEAPFPVETPQGSARLGPMDAAKKIDEDLYTVEWETGNVSSSHRAMNKLALGLIKGAITGGVLIVPTRELAQYLTDRVGNLRELEPYLDLWSSIGATRGYLGILAVEHDGVSESVPRIRKGTDGRASN